ncbi:MAG: ArnT family glycosyltransferase [Aggregatilineales bacterium]
MPRRHLWLFLILCLAVMLRIAHLQTYDPASVVEIYGGGDSNYYVNVGRTLVDGTVDYSDAPIAAAPLYLLISGFIQRFLPARDSIIALWLFHTLILTLCCYFMYRLGYRLTDDVRVGLVAAAAFATSVSSIGDTARILTEPIYIFFVLCSLTLYVDGYLNENHSILRRRLSLLFVGMLLGFATLTRAVIMLFPAGIVIHMLMLRRWKDIIPFLLAFFFIAGSWTAYTSSYFTWTVFGSDQFFPALWRGAVEEDSSPVENDILRGEESYSEQTVNIITQSPLDYLKLRIRELSGSYLQPYGTLGFGSDTLKTRAGAWVNSGFSPSVFMELIRADGFLPRLLIYIWHYVALIGGLIGMWLTRHRWRLSLPLIGFIAYTTLLHLVVLALPRYIYPTYPVYWIFASVTLVAIWDAARNRLHRPASAASQSVNQQPAHAE